MGLTAIVALRRGYSTPSTLGRLRGLVVCVPEAGPMTADMLCSRSEPWDGARSPTSPPWSLLTPDTTLPLRICPFVVFVFPPPPAVLGRGPGGLSSPKCSGRLGRPPCEAFDVVGDTSGDAASSSAVMRSILFAAAAADSRRGFRIPLCFRTKSCLLKMSWSGTQGTPGTSKASDSSLPVGKRTEPKRPEGSYLVLTGHGFK